VIGAYVRATPDLFRVGFAQMVAYRAEMTIWILSATLPLVMLALWNAVVEGGDIAGFGQADIARYFAATLIVRQLTGAWLVWELNWEIRSGTLSSKLLRPMNPLWPAAIGMLTAMPFRLVILAPILGGLIFWKPELLVLPSAPALLLFFVSVLLAWTLAFLVQAVFGILSFWLDQSLGLFGVWFGIWTLLSGYVAPLAFFPEGWARIARLLPFAGMLATPVEILAGVLPVEAAWGPVGAQLVWCALFGALTAWMWKRGVRRYGAFGA
jgi:ABC-2 type transport system permease protein